MNQRRVFRAGLLKPNAAVVHLDDLRLPVHVCLGLLEAATDQELEDIVVDCTHELNRAHRRTEARAA